ncbi:ABC transporter substrate-binding protein [Paenibacillus eucommiae]|uniref:Multiple sugar transport system substrate-binding protein n=1 Tax=Paenibacillus eucommiae TaxID=1355755 RepID=A0ABS4J565_9BACL|nr:extracellular solute-binding protein [Paenibacillus eucommiae]MBP1994933.1 multiple sugar transport system substrate-binding protein [Paenibacillus eucommiae]
MVKKTRLWYVMTAALLIVALVLAGCSSKNETPKPSDSALPAPSSSQSATTSPTSGGESQGIKIDPNKKVNLRYYTSQSYDQVAFEASYQDWQKMYPNIKVEMVLSSGSDFQTGVKMASIAGEQMDVIYMSADNMERANPDTLYLPLDELVARDGWDLTVEFGAYQEQLKVNGKLYGIPRGIAPDGVWYNKKYFEEAGLPDPSSGDWTWDEFFQAAKKLTKYDDEGNITRYGIHDWSFGGTSLSVATTRLALYSGWELVNTDGSFNMDWTNYKKAVELLYNAVYIDKSMASPSDIKAKGLHWQNDYYAGKTAMGIGGRNGAIFQDLAVEYGQLTKEEDDANIHTLAPMPRWDANSPKKQAYELVVGAAVSKTTKYPEEAYLFTKWFSTKSVEISSKVAHTMPASRLLDKSVLLENWRWYSDKNDKVTQGKQRDDLYSRMMDPEIKPIYFQNSGKFSYVAKMKLELDKHLSLLFAKEKSLDETIQNAKIATFKIYEEETAK